MNKSMYRFFFICFICCIIFIKGYSADHNSFYMRPDTGGVTLPVRLESFDVSIFDGNYVRVYWKTAEIWSNVYYEIQRSSDNQHFQTVGTVIPPDFTITTEFKYTDTLNSSDKNVSIWYYRLRQVDMMARSSYSTVKALRTSFPDNSVQVYPNPSSKDEPLYISLYNDKKTSITLQLVNQNGVTELQQTVTLSSGQQQVLINNSQSLSKGMIMIHIIPETGKASWLRLLRL